MNQNHKPFSDRISVLMSEYGTGVLSKMIGVSDTMLRKWRDGKSDPSLKSLLSLSEALNVSVEWLATGKEPAATTTVEALPVGQDSSDDELVYISEAPKGAAGTGHLISYDYAKTLLDTAVALEYIPENNQWVVTDFINMYNSIVSLRDPDGAEEAVLKQLVIRIQRSIESLQTMLSSSMYDDNTKAALEEGLKINKHELAKMKERLKDCTNRT